VAAKARTFGSTFELVLLLFFFLKNGETTNDEFM